MVLGSNLFFRQNSFMFVIVNVTPSGLVTSHVRLLAFWIATRAFSRAAGVWAEVQLGRPPELVFLMSQSRDGAGR